MNAWLKLTSEPLFEVGNECLVRVASMALALLLEGLCEVVHRNARNGDRVSAEVVELISDEHEAASDAELILERIGAPLVLRSDEVTAQGDFLRHVHRVDQLTVASRFRTLPAGAGDPVAHLSELDHIASTGRELPELAVDQGADTTHGIRVDPVVMVDDVAKEGTRSHYCRA